MSHQPSEETPEKDEKAPTSLFVGDLSFFCSETDLSSLFGQYGQVVSSQLKRGRSGDSLMHGFVEMESHEQADVARVTLTDKKFMGRRMRYIIFLFSSSDIHSSSLSVIEILFLNDLVSIPE